MVRVLQKCHCLFVDDTFRIAPRPYEQLVTVHGQYRGFVIPLAFCLLNGKTTGHYRQMFETLKMPFMLLHASECVPHVSYQFLIKFSCSIRNRISELYNIGMLYFHWTQSLWRNVQHGGSRIRIVQIYSSESFF
jgi:hypothetical protein